MMKKGICYPFVLFLAGGVEGWENQTSSLRRRELTDAVAVDVLILGAGVAGMAAATELQRFSNIPGNPSLTVKVIEAADRVGGRAEAAGWFAGGMEGHPIAEIAFRLYGNNINVATQNWASINYFNSFSKRLDRTRMNNAFNEAYLCLQRKAIQYQQVGSTLGDRTVEDVLKNDCGWNDSGNQEMYMRTWYNLQYESARENDKVSFSNLPLAPYIDQQDKDVFLIGQTFADIVKDELDSKGIDYVTGVKVTSVDYSSSPIVVTTTSGVYHAGTVIPTFSTGVLGTSVPLVLPSSNKQGMDKVSEMAVYARFTVQFPNVFFADTEEFIAITPSSSSQRGRCNYWQVLDTAWDSEFYPGSHTLVCVLTTEVIQAIETAGGKTLDPSTNEQFVTSTLKQLIRDSLGSIYPYVSTLSGWNFELKQIGSSAPPAETPPPQNTIYYTFDNHAYNDLWKGSYMNTPYVPGRTYDNLLASMADFRAPFGGGDGGKGVRLAGSATCLRYGGWMQGGYYSGIKVVKEFLEDSYPEYPHPNSKEWCEESPTTGLGTVLQSKQMG